MVTLPKVVCLFSPVAAAFVMQYTPSWYLCGYWFYCKNQYDLWNNRHCITGIQSENLSLKKVEKICSFLYLNAMVYGKYCEPSNLKTIPFFRWAIKQSFYFGITPIKCSRQIFLLRLFHFWYSKVFMYNLFDISYISK